jgi:hypothetical protein
VTERAPALLPRGWRLGLRILVAIAAVLALAFVVRAVGTDEVLASVRLAAPWLPLAALLELGRIGLDAVATRSVLGPAGRGIPLVRLFVLHLMTHGIMNVMPAGRGTSEAAKAMLLADDLGTETAVSMGTTNQANVLLSSAFFSLPCALAAHLALASAPLTLAILGHFAVLFAAGFGLRVLQTHPRAVQWLAGLLPRWSARVHAFAEASRRTPTLAAWPIAAMMLGRLLQTGEYAVLAHGVGLEVSAPAAFAVQGLNLVAAAVGVLVPGQLGSAEAIFALAADALGTTPAMAVSIALLAHTVSLGFASIGLSLLAASALLTRR